MISVIGTDDAHPFLGTNPLYKLASTMPAFETKLLTNLSQHVRVRQVSVIRFNQTKQMWQVRIGFSEPFTKEDQQLLDLFDAEASWPLIAITLERGVEEVQDRAGKLRHEVENGLTAKGR
jgi:hypothetical protein